MTEKLKQIIAAIAKAANVVGPFIGAERAVAALVRNIKHEDIPTTDADGNAITADEMRTLIEADAVAAAAAWHEDDDKPLPPQLSNVNAK